ncbi:xylose operon regulator [Actinobacillus equuli]|nr:xylose operon regulator [Actinobacillus equuli]
MAFLHLKQKGINQFAFYGIPSDEQNIGQWNVKMPS